MSLYLTWSLWEWLLWSIVLAITLGFGILFVTAASLMISQNTAVAKTRKRGSPVHILIVLGSGGHTAEMFYMLDQYKFDPKDSTYRTYVVSSGDNFSAGKARDFETKRGDGEEAHENYTILTVPRARRVHQSYLTAPFSTLHCFWTCLTILRGLHPEQRLLREYTAYPDLILTNGPATAVCMVVAAKLIRFGLFFLEWSSWLQGRSPVFTVSKLRTVYVESWARVSSLSTTGVILLPIADRFLVQWPAQAGRRAWWGMKKTQYAGWLVI
ncbi:unnamed protein product [Penicillium salamii]|uniref:UDP-N-acetylglucosamine transferase subunit ALG14 n=1 Tax=Penicillium salamii TaxID=1612424 RepID=A0A9W4N2C2_9EURO|nr:unnamed protein product [Penicillium salamii]CAG8196417.1 unnamed protein product [Penicillium salamii]CAG8212168.1 unnamed protein product [Penicillium salamii]CAG8230978.1 unnamed protein product [Penicillium salamii]CAG8296197.1 unnamed protein product [Penicillium salamii]